MTIKWAREGIRYFLRARPGGIANQNRGLVLFVARRQRDDELRQAGDFVHLFLDGDAGLQVLELDIAADFGKDREGERIPLGQDLADGDRLALVDAQARAVNDVVALLFAALFVHDGDQAGPVHGDEDVVAAVNGLEVEEADEAAAARLDLGLLG